LNVFFAFFDERRKVAITIQKVSRKRRFLFHIDQLGYCGPFELVYVAFA
jgi:hypothetical protein